MATNVPVPCRIHDPASGDISKTMVDWDGPEELLQGVEVPARLRPGAAVTLSALTVCPQSTPILIAWEGDGIRCAWSDAPARDDVDGVPTVVVGPHGDGPSTLEAEFSLPAEETSEPHVAHPRLRIDSLRRPPWFTFLSLSLGTASALLAIASLGAVLAGGFGYAPLAIVFAVIAGAMTPTAHRALDRIVPGLLPTQAETVGLLPLPGVVLEPAVDWDPALDNPVLRKYVACIARSETQLHGLGLMARPSLEGGYVPVGVVVRRGRARMGEVPLEPFSEVGRLISEDSRLRGLLDGDSMSGEELWHRHRRAAVIGEAGAGKTTLLRRLAGRLAEGPILWGASAPVLLELHSLARRDGLARNPVETMRSAVVDHILNTVSPSSEPATDQEDDEAPPTREEVDEAVADLVAGRGLTLMLDGLDEVSAAGADRNAAVDAILAAIDAICVAWPDARVIVSCREASVDRYRRLSDDFVVAEVAPFDEDSVRLFAHRYFLDAPEWATRLLDEIQRNPRMKGLTTTPLIMALVTMIFERRGTLPQRRAEIYRRCADLLLGDWDKERGRDRHPLFATEHKEEFLRRLAWALHEKGERFIDRAWLLAEFRAFAPSVGIPADDSDALIDEVLTHHGLLRRYDEGWYGFAHFALQEYYAAECIESLHPIDEALEHRHRAWWQEVIRLYAGRGDYTAVVAGLMSGREDYFRTNLRLAAECLTEQTAVEPFVREAVIHELAATARKTNVPGLDRRMWRALICAGGSKVVRHVWDSVSDDEIAPDIRADIVRNMAVWPPSDYIDSAVSRLEIEDTPPEIRDALIRLIATSGDRAAYDALARTVSNDARQLEVRVAAADVLSDAASDRIGDVFEGVLFDPKTPSEVRKPVARAMQAIGRPGILSRALEIVNDWHVDVAFRASVAAVVGALIDERTVREVVESVANPRIPPAVRTALAGSLRACDLGPSGSDVIELVRDRGTDYGVRLAVADTLCTVSTPDLEPGLRELHGDATVEEPIRVRIAIALGDQKMNRPLCDLLGDSSARQYLRLEAARILGSLNEPGIAERMFAIIDSRAVDPFGQELAVLVLDLMGDASLADPLVDRLSDRALPLSARLRMAKTLSILHARHLIGRILSLLPDRSFSAQLRGRLALTLSVLTDARDEHVSERVIEVLRETPDVPEIGTLAWHLSEQTGRAVYPEEVGAAPIEYLSYEPRPEDEPGGVEEAGPGAEEE